MKIDSSVVAMSGKRSYSKYQETHVKSVTMSATQWKALQEEAGADVSISEKSQSMLEQLREKKKEEAKKSVQDYLGNVQNAGEVERSTPQIRVQSKNEQMLKTLQRMLEMLKKIRKGNFVSSSGFLKQMSVESIMSVDSSFSNTAQRESQVFSLTQKVGVIDLRSNSGTSAAGSSSTGTTWIRHTETSGFLMEQESTSFSATGLVKTADGREIEFGVNLEMSRGFAGAFFSSRDEEVILTDPLVINLESANATVTDQKFFFDLDADGKEEKISFLGQGSGFLAYDKNGDGVINDGSELFGTKSGDGFADLAQYDEDGNGWIDENDSIFNDLKVWIKDENGNDKLLDLKEANVGAIYLGSANTQFHLNNTYTNQTNAVIRQTGVFLKETGEVGTVQHVDLAVDTYF